MTSIIIDRRLSGSGKNINNREKFLRRAKDKIKEVVRKSIADKDIKDIASGSGEKVKINSKDLSEPSFSEDHRTGNREYVVPGNKNYGVGDELPKPQDGNGGRGKDPSDGDDFEEDFSFILTKEEFIQYLFEDLELPDFIKETINNTKIVSWNRSGFTNSGSPANLNIQQTFKKSLGRRIALNRPTDDELQEAETLWMNSVEEDKPIQYSEELYDIWQELVRKRKTIPYIDETDLKYNLWTKEQKPKSQAVMFALMDVSGSMGEEEKDIAKRFFLLLYLFLERKYENIEIRFIRHTTEAQEVDERTFFYDRLSGGTTVSSGLKLISDIIKKEYSEDWNVYIAQCSDGDNIHSDNIICKEILEQELFDKIQYMSYIQVDPYDRGVLSAYYNAYSIWDTYMNLSLKHRKFEIRKVNNKTDVWVAFRSLFDRKS